METCITAVRNQFVAPSALTGSLTFVRACFGATAHSMGAMATLPEAATSGIAVAPRSIFGMASTAASSSEVSCTKSGHRSTEAYENVANMKERRPPTIGPASPLTLTNKSLSSRKIRSVIPGTIPIRPHFRV